MTTLPAGADADPEAAGFDAGRLARLDRRLDRYVDDGLLPGWQVLVTRDGHVAHLAQGGHRDVERACRSSPTPSGGSSR